ncbi:TonB-dependent receptor [Alteromonas stellipolaris]|uniref:TonB-dependent receptor n=1 Tax=Alteromonas stellipolaris TaxID=233316 RepID=A0AAW7YVV7_9ALTE|nr:TonB-dependent receptor [Alteromonas stellipolaris]MDO6576321.1 TonB-dependent receptor [Alteromonas stellipolaris]
MKTHNKSTITNTVRKPSFKLSLVSSALLSTLLAFQPQLAFAQSNLPSEDVKKNQTGDDVEDVEVIEVRGIKENLADAQLLKRYGDTFLDAISAKDIGALPDRSVLEAIVRLPGVSIERFAGANDPDHFGVEGSGVVVRGLTHTRSEFNGRDTFTADSGRGLSFQDVPPELMGGVELYKNQSAEMIEGGIAGTVNLITRKPFDSDKRILAFSADATYSDFIEKTTPTFSALYSDVFESDYGKWGLLLNFSDSTLKAQSDGTQVGRFETQNHLVDGESVMVPRTTRLTRKQDHRERQGLAAALQWENVDDTILATAQFIRSDSSLSWTERAIELADDAVINDLVPAEGTTFDIDEQGLFESGLITSNAGWRGNDAERQPGGIFGAQHAMITRAREQHSVVDDIGLNVRYRPNDEWAFSADLQYVESTSDIVDFSVMGATRTVVGITNNGDSTPDIFLTDPANANDETHFTNPYNYFWRSAMDHVSANEGDEAAVALDAKYTFEDGLFTSVKVGTRYAKRQQTTRQSTFNWGWLSEAWAGNGNAWFDAQGDELGAGLGDLYEAVSFDDFARGGVLTTPGGNTFLFPNESVADNYRDAESTFASLMPGWVALASRPGAIGDFLPNEINETTETNNAFFIQGNFEGEVKGLFFSGNVGARYVKIENETDGFITFPDNLAVQDDDPENFLPSDQAAFGNAASTEQTAVSDYSKLLPSFNLKLNLNDDMLLRFGYSKAIALPDLGNLRNYVEIQGDNLQIEYSGEGDDREITSAQYQRYTAKSGNPFLKPMEANNYDFAFEWYFPETVGSLTTSFFYKDLSNYFINGSTDRVYENNGVTQVVQVDGATNGDEGSVKGVEIAYQQFFDFLPGAWSGFGLQFNYTYVKDEGSPNPGLSPDKPDSSEGEGVAFDNLPLEGLSKDNVNIVAMYEKNGFNARLAYNWRSEYLLTTKDVITQLPIFNEANGQLDGSFFYRFSDNIELGLQGTNLSNTVTRTSMQVDAEGNQVGRSWFVNDRRISLVAKGTF